MTNEVHDGIAYTSVAALAGFLHLAKVIHSDVTDRRPALRLITEAVVPHSSSFCNAVELGGVSSSNESVALVANKDSFSLFLHWNQTSVEG